MSTFSKKISTISALAAGLVAFSAAGQAASVKGNNISLRIGSGHPPFITYVKSASKFFVPNVKRRVAAETKYKIRKAAEEEEKEFDPRPGVVPS